MTRWAWVTLILGSTTSPLVGQGIRFETGGIEPFWRIVAELTADREPADSLWDALWRTPGYALLDEKERRRPLLTRAFRLAYRPSLRDSLQAAQTGSGWLSFVLPHVASIPKHRDSLERFVAGLVAGDYPARGRSLAQRYLPDGATGRFPAPAASLLFFVDARGYPERLLLDPLYFMRISDPVEVLAHEFHHYYRSHVARPSRPYGDDLLAWVLTTTESEGIAGLLDKGDVPGLGPEQLERKYRSSPQRLEYFRTYQREYRRADHWLRRVENVLERVGRYPDSSAILGRELHREIPDNGRILGAFMGAAIERRRGREAVVAVVGDPFGFWRAYGQAATGSDLPRGLSVEALATLSLIESKYRVP